MWLFVGHGALDGDVRGEVIPLCGLCAALLKADGKGPGSFLSFSSGSATEEACWGVVCQFEFEARVYMTALSDGPSASKRFPGDEDRENAKNREAERRALRRNREEDRQAAKLDRE